MSSRKPALVFVFFVLLLDVIGFGLIIPVAPRLVQQLQGGGEAAAAPVVGWLTATYAAMQFLFAPILGALSDRVGRRPVLLLSMLGSGLDYIAMALVPTVPWLFVTRALNGVSGASITAASAYIADVTPPEKRAAGYGVLGAAFGLGFVVGPLLGGILGEIDLRLPFLVAGGLALANFAFGLFVMPESLPVERRRASPLANPLAGIAVLRRHTLAARLALVLLFLHLAQFALHVTWALYTQYRFGWSERDIGLSLFAVGIGAMIVQGGLARRVIPRLGERRAILLGIALIAVAYIGYGAATAGWMMYAAIVVQSLGGLAGPATQAMVANSVPPTEQGVVHGSLTSMQGLANIAGPVLGSALFAWSIGPAREQPMPGLVFFGCAALATIGLVIAFVVLQRRTSRPPAAILTPESEVP